MSFIQALNRLLVDDLVIGVLDLIEAEGRSLRRSVFRVALSITLLLLGLVFVLAAFAFTFVGLYLLLNPAVGVVGAAFLCAAFALLAGLSIILWSRRRVR
jgi:hypothetical protein